MNLGTAPESVAIFSCITILLYVVTRRLHAHLPRWWTSPLFLAPIALVAAALFFGVEYSNYIQSTRWLVLFLGPVTVAFAIPIYEQRMLIARNWRILTVGLVVGSITSIVSSWVIATMLGLEPAVRLSLLPRSISTPFAMSVSGAIGGTPDITAVFVAITGVCGAGIGEAIIQRLPIQSSVAKGALLGMGAHGAGVAKAKQLGPEEASVAGLLMVLVGLTNVLLAPLASSLARYLFRQ